MQTPKPKISLYDRITKMPVLLVYGYLWKTNKCGIELGGAQFIDIGMVPIPVGLGLPTDTFDRHASKTHI